MAAARGCGCTSHRTTCTAADRCCSSGHSCVAPTPAQTPALAFSLSLYPQFTLMFALLILSLSVAGLTHLTELGVTAFSCSSDASQSAGCSLARQQDASRQKDQSQVVRHTGIHTHSHAYTFESERHDTTLHTRCCCRRGCCCENTPVVPLPCSPSLVVAPRHSQSCHMYEWRPLNRSRQQPVTHRIVAAWHVATD